MLAPRLALAALLPLAACAAPADPPPSDPPPASGGGTFLPVPAPPPPEAETPEARARAAGLSAAQAAQIASLPAPVALPAQMSGWTVDRFEAEEMTEMGPGLIDFRVRWRRADGACAEILGSNEGLGGPGYPIVSTTVSLPRLPGAPEAAVYKAADDPGATSAQTWGPGTVVSDYVPIGGGVSVWLLSNDEGGCRPLALEEGAQILSRLRLLGDGPGAGGAASPDPLDDPVLGRFAFDDGVTADGMWGETPEQSAALWYEEVQDPIEIRTLVPGRVLVTQTDLADDSVRDLRTLFVFERRGGAWGFVVAGTQVRCQPGRGHQDWSAADCL